MQARICAANEFGGVIKYNGAAWCGAGDCVVYMGQPWCSQFPGGGITINNGSVYSGPGECIDHRGHVWCAKKPRGKCFSHNGRALCEQGAVRELAVYAQPCNRATELR